MSTLQNSDETIMKFYTRFVFLTPPESRDPLIALLSELPFDAFAETEDGFITGIQGNNPGPQLFQTIDSLKAHLPFHYSVETLANQNWNEKWESSFDEILIGDFCQIRAPFHDINQAVEHQILIEPRMAFGTGHHETTRLMIGWMQEIEYDDKVILDHGSGTGILAILAAKMNAQTATAVECDEGAFENLKENIILNQTPEIECVLACDLTGFADNTFELIMVNITRNTILDQLDELVRVLQPKGKLITSGYLEKDRKIMEEKTGGLSLQCLGTKLENGWVSMLFRKP